MIENVEKGLLNTKLITTEHKVPRSNQCDQSSLLSHSKLFSLTVSVLQVLSRWHVRLEHGYPTPFLGRDEVRPAVDVASSARCCSWAWSVLIHPRCWFA